MTTYSVCVQHSAALATNRRMLDWHDSSHVDGSGEALLAQLEVKYLHGILDLSRRASVTVPCIDCIGAVDLCFCSTHLPNWHVSTVLGTLQQKSPMPRANGALCQQVRVAAKHTCILSMLEA